MACYRDSFTFLLNFGNVQEVINIHTHSQIILVGDRFFFLPSKGIGFSSSCLTDILYSYAVLSA
jgi:hypothetical protein